MRSEKCIYNDKSSNGGVQDNSFFIIDEYKNTAGDIADDVKQDDCFKSSWFEYPDENLINDLVEYGQ